jgi:hypothetical protein
VRRVDLELLVQRAVEDRRAGRPVEDDRLEFKSDWPGPERARQLAGAANALRGVPLVYVIGVDDSGAIRPLTETDPSDWHATFTAAFDSAPPRLVMHLTVATGDAEGDAVVALLFETDEFPYVMQVGAAAPDRREVPIRVASGTASANRHQLMRILAPTVASPPCAITELDLTARRSHFAATVPPPGPPHSPQAVGLPERDELTLNLQGRVFIEYTGTHVATIPTRTVKAVVSVGGHSFEAEVHVNELSAGISRGGMGPNPEPVPPTYGVYAKSRMIVATGPGEFSFRFWHSLSTVFSVH